MPTILAAVIMVAGIFAFLPVEDASTVHTGEGSLQSATQTRIVETLDDSTGLSGQIIIERSDGAGVFTIEKLSICDKEWDNNTASTWIFFTVETELVGNSLLKAGSALEAGDFQDADEYSGSGVMLHRGHVVKAVISGSQGAVASQADGTCADIMEVSHNSATGSGNRITLGGNEDNDVILTFFDARFGDKTGDGDNAFLIAYITGAPAGDITITNNLND